MGKGKCYFMKKKLFSLAVICICLSVVSAGTLAYYTANETAHNVITTGNVDIELLETTDDGTDFTNVTGVMPGTDVSKIVEVKNIGDNDAWIRVQVDKAIQLAAGQTGEVDLNLLTIDYNTAEWTERGDFYYYNRVLAPEAKTEPLFTKVAFSGAMGNMYQNSTASVYVYAQATQVDNNGDNVFEANGWPTKE